MTAPAFTLEDATLRYDRVTALDGVDLTIGPGERVAVIGPSGAGKSSLLALLGGSAVATAGRVTSLGCDLARARPREERTVRRRIGVVHQHLDLVEELRVVHNVNAGRLGTWPWWRAAASLVRPLGVDDVRAALDRVGIAETLHARTSTLSGGQKQRVAVARVLVARPRAVLADEPVASLDPRRGAEVIDLLCGLADADGTTLVASLHDVGLALGRFERVIALRDGRVVLDRAPREVSDADVDDLYATA